LHGSLRGKCIHNFGAAGDAYHRDDAFGWNIAFILQTDTVDSFAAHENPFWAANIGGENRRLIGREYIWVCAASGPQRFTERFFATRRLNRGNA